VRKSNEKQARHIVKLLSVHTNTTSSMKQYPVPSFRVQVMEI